MGDMSWAELPAVRAAAAAGQYGQVLRMARTAADLSLAEAGRLVGYSAASMSRLERGKRPLTDLTLLRRLTVVFDIPPALFGLAAADTPTLDRPPVGSSAARVRGKPAREDDPVLRRELLAGIAGVTGGIAVGRPATAGPPAVSLDQLLLPGNGDGEPVPLAALTSRLAAARRAFDTCQYGILRDRLPRLIHVAQASTTAATGTKRDQAEAVTARTYCLASELATKLDADAIAWVAADRALHHATASGDTAAVAVASHRASVGMRRHGHRDGAITLLTTAADELHLGAQSDPGAYAVYSNLLCTAAYTAAQAGDRQRALELVDEAERAAAHTAPGTRFGSAQVTVYRIGIHTTLGDPGTALHHARTVSLRALPSPERQARLCVDTARAWHQFGSRDRAYDALRTAEHVAPEEIRRPSVQRIVTSLLTDPQPEPPGLRTFAARCGVTA